jgi:hypothetical protein
VTEAPARLHVAAGERVLCRRVAGLGDPVGRILRPVDEPLLNGMINTLKRRMPVGYRCFDCLLSTPSSCLLRAPVRPEYPPAGRQLIACERSRTSQRGTRGDGNGHIDPEPVEPQCHNRDVFDPPSTYVHCHRVRKTQLLLRIRTVGVRDRWEYPDLNAGG